MYDYVDSDVIFSKSKSKTVTIHPVHHMKADSGKGSHGRHVHRCLNGFCRPVYAVDDADDRPSVLLILLRKCIQPPTHPPPKKEKESTQNKTGWLTKN